MCIGGKEKKNSQSPGKRSSGMKVFRRRASNEGCRLRLECNTKRQMSLQQAKAHFLSSD